MKAHGEIGSAEQYTPPWVISIVRELLGGIDLDPCSCELANGVVNAETYYTAEMDGLSLPWYGLVFVNPPGGKAKLTQKFWAKLSEHYVQEDVAAACFLSFSIDALQTTQRHGPTSLLDYYTWIPNRRFDYWTSQGGQNGAVRPSALTWLPSAGDTRPLPEVMAAAVAKHAPMPGKIVGALC